MIWRRKMNKDKAINLAIDNTIREGLNDIFERPFEIECLRDEGVRKEVYNEVLSSLKDYNLSNLRINPIEYVLMPKKDLYDFRRCALINPLDNIKYLSLILTIADEIEKKRINKRRNKVFSYRFNPNDGNLFDKNYNYTTFKKYVNKKAESDRVKVLVECDISNFYDRLNLHRLECVLRSIDGIEDSVVNLINQLLLFWANRDSYGLPVGGNASRILAEASLIEVDNFLISKNVEFTRYVDDYRLFAPNARIANQWLSLLVDKLSQEGLFINTKKTIFRDVSQKKRKQGTDDNVKLETPQDKSKDKSLKIISSYSGVIPRKFREATEKEVDAIKNNVNVDELFNEVNELVIFEPKKFKLLIKAIIYLGRYEYLNKIPNLLERMPQFIPYFTDVLIKYEDEIEIEIANEIKERFSEWFQTNELPEYIMIYIARVLGRDKYENRNVLFDTFINLKRNSGSYIGRVLLEEIEENLNRGKVIQIKEYYFRATMWEKRQITRIIHKNLFEDEKRPWLKNVEINSNDIFEKAIFKKYKPPKKNNKESNKMSKIK